MTNCEMSIKLLSGNMMPLIGFGTFQIRGSQLIYDVLDNALRVGFRSIDTAAVYGNEQDIGFALKKLLPKYGLTREDIFITSKLSPSDHGERVLSAIERSLSNLGLKYLDLYLIHWPGASGIPVDSSDNKYLREQSWKALVRAKERKLVNAIGVSNYTVRHLEELLKNPGCVKPDVNQVEWHPHYYQPELLDFCRKEGILLQAYSSLGSSNYKTLLQDPTVNEVARKLNKTVAQILLRWALQQGIGIIPKARSKQHIEENFQLNFTIPDEYMNMLSNISRKRKPSQDQWTVLAAIVKYNGLSNDYEVVALGTGSKCIGASKMSPEGDILNDSHGEIICRRSFLRYLYNQVNYALEDKESIFSKNRNKLVLRDEYTFHFFITQMPCGDAAIFAKQNSDEFGDCLVNYPGEKNALKRSCEEDMQSPCKKLKNEEDIHRTGAKCLKDEPKQDLRLSGSEYHTLGAIRTKPGRGDPTLSVSCSDKLAKWTFLGIQGALLSLLIESPIYLSSVTVAGEVPYSKDAMLRALRDRFRVRDIEKPYCHKIPDIGQADVGFQYYKTDFKRPCPSSISWCNTPFKPAEFVIDGRKQGITKKHENKKISRLLISKKELFCTCIDIISKHNMFNLSNITNISYSAMKSRAVLYSTVWNYIKNNIFKIWTVKNKELLNFSYD